MNLAATHLTRAIASQPLVISLHAPNGETRLVYAHTQPRQVAVILREWAAEYFARGYMVMSWWNGLPSETFNARNRP